MVDGVSRATWTPIPADRGQVSEMIVDTFQVAAEWRSRCRADIVNTIAMTMNPPREPGYRGASPLAKITWSKRIPCPKKRNGRHRGSGGQLPRDCHCVRCPARQCLSRRSTAERVSQHRCRRGYGKEKSGASAARAADRVWVDLEFGISKIGNRSSPPPNVDTREESAAITTDSAALSTMAWNRWIS